MNLHAIVSGGIGQVNPSQVVAISENVGYTTNSDGTQVPSYNTFQAVAQIQAATFKDLMQTGGLNQNGVRRAMYFYGEVDAIVRILQKGGDLITDSYGNVWLVNQNVEQWDGWCRVVVTLQDQQQIPATNN